MSEQAPVAPEYAPQAPQDTPPAVPVPPPETPPAAPVQPSPDIAALQQQLQAERQQREHIQQRYESLVPEYTRTRQQLQAVVGAQTPATPADPIAPLARRMAQEYDISIDDATRLARANYSMMNEMVAPLQKENQQLRQVMTQTPQIDSHLAQLQRDRPDLITPQVWDYTKQQAQALLNGGGQIDAYTMRVMALDIHDQLSRMPQPQPSNQPPPPAPQPFAGGMYGVRPGYQPQPPPQASAPQLSPQAQALQDHINARIARKP